MKKIIIVDDNKDLTRAVKRRLEKMDDSYDIICANSGKDCFNLLRDGQIPDLILLDIMMPEMDGWNVAAELKKNPQWTSIPIVFLTAKTDSSSKTYGKIVSADYIEKPFEIDDLKRRIDKMLWGNKAWRS